MGHILSEEHAIHFKEMHNYGYKRGHTKNQQIYNYLIPHRETTIMS